MIRPLVFSRAVLCLALIAVLFLPVSFSASNRPSPGAANSAATATAGLPLSVNLQASEYAIHELVNRERSRRGLVELAWDPRLAEMARTYSRRMAREAFFSHYDGGGNSVVERARDHRIRGWRKIGENLFFSEGYRNFSTVAVRGWMNSSEHRQNILDRSYTATGIGIARTRNGRIYVTQVFIED